MSQSLWKSVLTCLASVILSCVAFADGESLSFNIRGNVDVISGAETSGLVPVANDQWNDINVSHGTTTLSAVKDNSGTATVVSLTATGGGSWFYDATSSLGAMGNGYSDGAWTLNFVGVPYSQFDVILYMATDWSSRWGAVGLTAAGTTTYYAYPYVEEPAVLTGEAMYAVDTLNGTAVAADARWGKSRLSIHGYGVDVMRIKGVTAPNFTLVTAGNAGENNYGSATRGGLYGFQIVNTGTVQTAETFTASPAGTGPFNFSTLSWDHGGSVEGALNTATVTLEPGATLNLDAAPTLKTLILKCPAGVASVTASVGNPLANVVQVAVGDTSSSVDFGALAISSLTIPVGTTAAVNDRPQITTLSQEGALRLAGGAALTDFSLPSTIDSGKTLIVDKAIASVREVGEADRGEGYFSVNGGRTLEIGPAGAIAVATRFATCDVGSSGNVRHTGGTVTVAGTGTDFGSTTGTAVLFSHWGQPTTYNLDKGTLDASKGGVSLGWTGIPTVTVGTSAETSDAWLKAKQLGGHSRSDQGSGGSLTVNPSGVVELGSGGITFGEYKRDVTVELAGGQLAFTETAPLNISNAAGLKVTAASTMNVAEGKTVTVSAAVTGAGTLAKAGLGTAVFTGGFSAPLKVDAGVAAFGVARAIPVSSITSGAKVRLTRQTNETVEIQVTGTSLADGTTWDAASVPFEVVESEGTAVTLYGGTVAGGTVTLNLTDPTALPVWTAGTDGTGNWSDTARWSAVPGADAAVVIDVGTGSAAVTLTVDAALSSALSSILVRGSAPLRIVRTGSATLSAPSGITIATDASVTTPAAEVFASPVVVNGEWTVETDGQTEYSGVISGSGRLRKTGTGALLLTGTAANTYSGGTFIDGGRIGFASGGLGTGAIAIADGATGLWLWAGDVTLPNDLSLAGSAVAFYIPVNRTLTLSGVLSGSGAATVTTASGSGTLTLTNAALRSCTYDGDLSLTAGTTLKWGDNSGGLAVNTAYKLAKSLTIPTGAMLFVHPWTTSALDKTSTNKITFDTPITLAGGTIHTEDGSYFFRADITVTVPSVFEQKWAKGIVVNQLAGSGDFTWRAAVGSDTATAWSALYWAENYSGTLTLTRTGTGPRIFALDSTSALNKAHLRMDDANTTCQFGGSRTLGALSGVGTIQASTGTQTLTIGGFSDVTARTFSGVIADSITLSMGASAAPLTLTGTLGAVAEGVGTYTQALTVGAGASLALALASPTTLSGTLSGAGALTVGDGSAATVLMIGGTQSDYTGALSVATGATLLSTNAIAAPLTFADGAILDATGGALTVSGDVTFGGALTVKVTVATAEGTQVLSKSGIAAPAAYTLLAGGVAAEAGTVLAARADGLYVSKPTITPPSGGETVSDEATAAIAQIAADAGLASATVTVMKSDGITAGGSVDAAALFLGVTSATVTEGTTGTVMIAYDFGIERLTIRSLSAEVAGGTAGNYVVLAAKVQGVNAGADYAAGTAVEVWLGSTKCDAAVPMATDPEGQPPATGVKWFRIPYNPETPGSPFAGVGSYNFTVKATSAMP